MSKAAGRLGPAILTAAMETPVVTRVEFDGPVPTRRTFADRLTVRFPRTARMLLALGMRLSRPRSGVRRDGVRRVLRSAWAAAPRKDWELMFARYSPEVVWEIPEEFQTLGFAPSYRGHAGLVEGLEQFSEAFESWEIRPARALDFGDRVLALGSFRGKARASGVEWQQPFSQLVTLASGLVIRDRFFYSWEQGLRAAGLKPEDWP
jgi:ketosteroid isomerase-like protein